VAHNVSAAALSGSGTGTVSGAISGSSVATAPLAIGLGAANLGPLYNGCLLSRSQCGRVEVILVSPRNPLNIGAAARAMANFGFRRLTVVAPWEEHWREAKSAVGAAALLKNAKRAECLAEALADCTLVLGTAAVMHRKPEQPVVALPDLGPIVYEEFARGGRVALVFGPEKRGLTRDELSHCHWLVEIPTDSRQPSMNLGQAVAVCLYQLAVGTSLKKPASGSKRAHRDRPGRKTSRADSNCVDPASAQDASAQDLELLAGVIEQTLVAAEYSPASMRNANRHDLHLMLRRLSVSRPDARRMLGVFRSILWKLKNSANGKPDSRGLK
jgi:TrmH family RNA methyltransferase